MTDVELNEPELPDYYPIYGDLYVADGKVIRSDWHGITARQFKAREKVTTLCRCDVIGRVTNLFRKLDGRPGRDRSVSEGDTETMSKNDAPSATAITPQQVIERLEDPRGLQGHEVAEIVNRVWLPLIKPALLAYGQPTDLERELTAALRDLHAAVEKNPSMQGRQYVGLGIAVTNVLTKATERRL